MSMSLLFMTSTVIHIYQAVFLQPFIAHHQPAPRVRASVDYSLCANPVGTQFFAFFSREQTRTGGVKRCTPSTLGSTPVDLHFHMFLPQLVRVFCIFYAGFFTGPSYRPRETRGGCYVLLPPPLTY